MVLSIVMRRRWVVKWEIRFLGLGWFGGFTTRKKEKVVIGELDQSSKFLTWHSLRGRATLFPIPALPWIGATKPRPWYHLIIPFGIGNSSSIGGRIWHWVLGFSIQIDIIRSSSPIAMFTELPYQSLCISFFLTSCLIPYSIPLFLVIHKSNLVPFLSNCTSNAAEKCWEEGTHSILLIYAEYLI